MVPGEEWKRKRWITMDRSERGGVKVEKKVEKEKVQKKGRDRKRETKG